MICINNGWQFSKLPSLTIENISNIDDINAENFVSVDLPHTWYKDGDLYEGLAVYTKKIKLDFKYDQHAFLQFEAVDRWCKLYVNGTFVGEHKGGYAAFSFDITRYCNRCTENKVTVFVDNRSFGIISPLAGDFTVFGGIYRNVNVVIVGSNCFDRSFYGTDGVIICTDMNNDEGVIDIQSHLLRTGDQKLLLRYTCSDKEQNVVAADMVEVDEKIIHSKLVVNKPLLWDGLENANLYSIKTELLSDGNVIDCVKKQIGFRKVFVDANEGFSLNGNKVKIKGVAKHQDFAEVFCATKKEHWEKDCRDILEIGANSVRLSHYQHPQGMYDLCDRNGLIVWAEIPFLKINETDEFYDNACLQLRELILQNIHHPSICFWGIQNEIAMFAENETTYEQVKGLNSIVKELDQTRISAGANLFCVKNDSELNKITDVIGYNIYFGWYYGEMKDNEGFVDAFHKDNPTIPLGITEYGVDSNLAFHSSNPKVKDYSEEYQALYHETVYPIFAAKDYIWGTYVWNLYDFSSGIRDEGGVKYKNCKGLVSYDRETQKDAYYYYKAVWSKVPFVKIAGTRYMNRVVGKTTVKVYSNQKEVVLSINNTEGYSEYTLQSNNGVFIFDQVNLSLGENAVSVVSEEVTDTYTFIAQENEDRSYVFVDPNPGVNVKNWFIDALEEEKLFPTGMYSIRESCLELLKCDQAMEVISDFNKNLASQMKKRQSSMPLERILNYMKKEITEDQCKELNAQLIKIRKMEKV